MSVLHHIPQVVPLPRKLRAKTQIIKKKKKSKKQDSDEDEDNWGLHIHSKQFSYLKTRFPPRHQPSYHEHKLAVILSILAANNHFPKTHSSQTRLVKVGVAENRDRSCPERVKQIPLLQFCYAVLNGEEESIFTMEDYNRIKELYPISIKEKDENKKTKKYSNSEESKETFAEDEDLTDKDDKPIFQVLPEIEATLCAEFTSHYEDVRYHQTHIGVSPDINGPFEPFVYYLKVQGTKLISKQEPTYRWKTDETGWAPGFYNASFNWFYHLTIDSVYNEQENSITVSQTQAREMVN